jgi:DNA-binding PadR family transcriptional regulator
MGEWSRGGWDRGWGGGAAWGGPWGGQGGHPGRHGRPGPPPWLSGLFGLAQPEPQPGPRVRRGDVRSAILSVLAEEPMNGYQVMSRIAERSGGAWRPSPGSVYPTIQQLEDEGLVEGTQEGGRRKLKPTAAGWDYINDHRAELDDVWTPFDAARPEGERESAGSGFGDVKPEIGRVMSAVWQIVTQGTERQRRDAVAVLVETRRRLYGILADGDQPGEES